MITVSRETARAALAYPLAITLLAATAAGVWFTVAGVVAAVIAWPLLAPVAVAAALVAAGATATPPGAATTHLEGQ